MTADLSARYVVRDTPWRTDVFGTARWRLTLWFALALGVILVVTGAAVYLTTQAVLFDQVNSDLESRAGREQRLLAPRLSGGRDRLRKRSTSRRDDRRSRLPSHPPHRPAAPTKGRGEAWPVTPSRIRRHAPM